MLMFIFLTIVVSSSLSCLPYQCYSTGSFSEKQCIFASKQSVQIKPCTSSLVPFCEAQSKNSTCQPSPIKNLTSTSWPGENCEKDSQCAFGMCFKGTCNSFDLGKACALDDQCNPGLFCNTSSKTCVFQKRLGEAGCSQDTDCLNSAGCNKGLCVKYYTLPGGSDLDKCDQNMNRLCKSLTCGKIGDKVVCGNGVKLNGTDCNSSSDCLSTVDDVLGYSLNSDCKCSLSKKPESLCTLFPGDDDFKSYIEKEKSWVGSKEIRKCNTQRRFADGCLKQSNEGTVVMYWRMKVELYPMIENNEKCTKQVFNTQYWHLDESLSDEEKVRIAY